MLPVQCDSAAAVQSTRALRSDSASLAARRHGVSYRGRSRAGDTAFLTGGAAETPAPPYRAFGDTVTDGLAARRSAPPFRAFDLRVGTPSGGASYGFGDEAQEGVFCGVVSKAANSQESNKNT